VVIPTRNRWSQLRRFALTATGAQEEVGVETVVVDDGSPSPPPASITDRDLRLVRLPRHAGVARARNVGWRNSDARWVAFLDDDDMWSPRKLVTILAVLEGQRADFGYSAVLVVDERLRPTKTLPATPPGALMDELRVSNGVYAAASNLVVRRALLEEIDGFDEEFSTAADWEILQRLAAAGQACAVAEPLVAYRASGWLVTDEPRHRADLERLVAKHPGVRIDWAAYENWIARSLHRAGRRREAAKRYLAVAMRERSAKGVLRAATPIMRRERIERVRRPRDLTRPSWLDLYSTT
jgi:glycosyltransferase involved in cell wall biosynthesis